MQKFEAAKLFLRMFKEFTQDFDVVCDNTGREVIYAIQHKESKTRVLLKVTGNVTAYVVDPNTDLNYVDPDTMNEIEVLATQTLEKRHEEAKVAKDNSLVYNITEIYAKQGK